MKKIKLKDIVYPLVAFFGIFVLLAFFTLPTFTGLFDKIAKSDLYDRNIKIYEENIKRLGAISTNDINTKFVILNKEIPVGGDVINLVNDAIKVAESFGLIATTDLANQNEVSVTTTVSVSRTLIPAKQALDIGDARSGDPEKVPESILINGSVYPIQLTLSIGGTKESILAYYKSLSDDKRNVVGIANQDRIMNIVLSEMTDTVEMKNEFNAKLTIYAYAVLDIKPKLEPTKILDDPLDQRLSNPAKEIKTN